MTRNAPQREIKSVTNVFDILEVIHDEGGATLTEIHGEIDLAQSTLHDYLQTLTRHGYVIKEDQTYYVSLRFLDLGTQAKLTRTVWRDVRPGLVEVAKETGENVWFMVEENGYAVHVDNYSGERVLYEFNAPGTYEYLHCLAGGKAIMAHLSEERVDQIVDRRGLPKFTDSTITDRETLRSELAEIRERGIAFSDGERREEIRAVASPIVYGDEVLGAISVGAPTKRLTGDFFDGELPNLVSGAANRIEFSFEHGK